METLLRMFGSCIGWCVGISVCKCYEGAVSVQDPFVSRLWNVLLYIVFIGTGYVLIGWGEAILWSLPGVAGHYQDQLLEFLCPREICGTLLVYRLSLGYFVFYVLLALLLAGAMDQGDYRARLQNACWGFKVPLLTVLVLLAAITPHVILLAFGWLMLALALVFIGVQLVSMSSFSYTLVDFNTSMGFMDLHDKQHVTVSSSPSQTYAHQSLGQHFRSVGKPAYRPNIWSPMIVVATLVLFLVLVAVNLYMFYLLEWLPKCHTNLVVLGLHFTLLLLIYVASVHPKVRKASRGKSGVFQSTVVAMFSTYLTWNAIIVNDTGQCTQPYVQEGLIYGTTLVIGWFFAIAVGFFCSVPVFGKRSDQYNYSRSNLVYAAIACYLTMLLTNWSVVRHTVSIIFQDASNTIAPYDASLLVDTLAAASGANVSSSITSSSSSSVSTIVEEYYLVDLGDIAQHWGWVPMVVYIFSLVLLNLLYMLCLLGPVFCPDRYASLYEPHSLDVVATERQQQHQQCIEDEEEEVI